ncbi:hypothetical protein ES703_33172 [subsurface metagenome]
MSIKPGVKTTFADISEMGGGMGSLCKMGTFKEVFLKYTSAIKLVGLKSCSGVKILTSASASPTIQN